MLASQHFRSIVQALGPAVTKELGVRLLTGQQPLAMRKKTLLDMASGNCRLVIGTHALLSDNVSFFDLGLVIIDEQHRFGVGQREALKSKAKHSPHSLVMTATPIPRTLAVTVFGDLDISYLRELPKGRQPILTHVVDISRKDLVARVWERVSEEVSAGRQAFVVCPKIDPQQTEDTGAMVPHSENLESEHGLEPASVTSVFASLENNKMLAGIRIGLLHGRMSSREKDEVMDQFESGQLQVLVATTVIEVGVNVPNASTMVVLDADHFGLSQLHQLRGRVGRGKIQGTCILLFKGKLSKNAIKRIKILKSTDDGFLIADEDLKLRGFGDILGFQQSGIKNFRLADPIHHEELFKLAENNIKDIDKQNISYDKFSFLLRLFDKAEVINEID